MNTVIKYVLIFAIAQSILNYPIQLKENKWNDLVPLKSTRADVEKIFGKSSSKCNCSYNFPDIYVHFAYSTGECQSGWKIEAGKVVNISIGLKKEAKLSDLQFDEKEFIKKPYIELPDNTIYVSNRLGIMFIVRNDVVTNISYTPKSSDDNLKCKP